MGKPRRAYRPDSLDRLEDRLVLSHAPTAAHVVALARHRPPRRQPPRHQPAVHPAVAHRPVAHRAVAHVSGPKMVIDAINQQYDAFLNDFHMAEAMYASSMGAPATPTSTVASATLTSPHVPGDGTLVVTDGTVFGSPTTVSPLTITAQTGAGTIATFRATGRVGNVLTGVVGFNANAGSSGQPTTAVIDSMLAEAHTPRSGTFVVANGEAFGNPTREQPVVITVKTASNTIELYQATGRVGNVLTGVQGYSAVTDTFGSSFAIDDALPAGTIFQAKVSASAGASPSDIALAAGTVLQANASATGGSATSGPANDNTGALLQSYIGPRANLLAQTLIGNINRLRVGQPGSIKTRDAVPTFVRQQVLGTDPTCLSQALSTIPLPTSSGPALWVYNQAVESAVAACRLRSIKGVSLIYSGVDILYVPPALIPAPAVGGGASVSTGTTGGGGSSSSSGSSTSGTGSTTS